MHLPKTDSIILIHTTYEANQVCYPSRSFTSL